MKVDHQNHEVATIAEEEGFSQNLQVSLQAKIKVLSETCNKLHDLTSFSNKKLNQIVDEIIFELQKFKKNNEEKSLKISKISASQNEMIQSVLAKVQQEITQKNVHPNKQFHIMKAINELNISKKPTSLTENFNAHSENAKIAELAKIKQMVQNLELIKIQPPQKNNAIENNFNDFKSNPIELLQKTTPEHVIEEKSFYINWGQSNSSCSFTMNGETFMAWCGYSKNNQSTVNYPLKKKQSFPNEARNEHTT